MATTATTNPYEQRIAALESANKVRIAAADLKKEIGMMGHQQGLERVLCILEAADISDVAGALSVRQLLLAVPWVGERKLHQFLDIAAIRRGRENRRLRDWTLGERSRLALAIRDRLHFITARTSKFTEKVDGFLREHPGDDFDYREIADATEIEDWRIPSILTHLRAVGRIYSRSDGRRVPLRWGSIGENS